MTRLVDQFTVARDISTYLLTGMHHTTTEGQAEIASLVHQLVGELQDQLADAGILLGVDWKLAVHQAHGDLRAAREVIIGHLTGQLAELEATKTQLVAENRVLQAQLRSLVAVAQDATTAGYTQAQLRLEALRTTLTVYLAERSTDGQAALRLRLAELIV